MDDDFHPLEADRTGNLMSSTLETAAQTNIEYRKVLEIGHYDGKARQWHALPSNDKWERDVHGLRHDDFTSYDRFREIIAGRCKGKRVLDYGCGTGLHSSWPAFHGAQVVGIDLSQESLAIARERAKRLGLEDKISFTHMDCERLDLPGSSVDVVIDGGTFSSLDMTRALPEIARVLQDDGCLIGIETFGHNPLMNLKRKLNVLRGVRTSWASRHIMTTKDFDKARRHFRHAEMHHFHLLGAFLLPLVRIPGIRRAIRWIDRIDSALFRISLLRRLAFKVVFVLSHPIRQQ